VALKPTRWRTGQLSVNALPGRRKGWLRVSRPPLLCPKCPNGAGSAAVSRRQPQRIVKRAHQQLVDDLELVGVERVHVVAQLHTALFSAMATALSRNQPAVVVGASRALMDLLQLTSTRRSL